MFPPFPIKQNLFADARVIKKPLEDKRRNIMSVQLPGERDIYAADILKNLVVLAKLGRLGHDQSSKMVDARFTTR